MGNRSNIYFRDNDNGIGVYSHWSGRDMAKAAAWLLQKPAFKARLRDAPYATRIGVQTVLERLGSSSNDETGFGIWSAETGPCDITSRTIRTVGKPEDRFDEDKLRAIRALRFEITKKMHVDPDVSRVIDQLMVKDYDGVSTDRIRDEVHKMFAADTSRSIVSLFHRRWIRDLLTARGIWLKATTEKV